MYMYKQDEVFAIGLRTLYLEFAHFFTKYLHRLALKSNIAKDGIVIVFLVSTFLHLRSDAFTTLKLVNKIKNLEIICKCERQH